MSTGYATLGRIGFEGRYDYAAIGDAVILASRLGAEARAGQILLGQRTYAAVEDLIEVEPAGELELKGISRPVRPMTWSATRARSRDRRPTRRGGGYDERLRRLEEEYLARQAATDEVLKVIGQSGFDLQAVLDAVAHERHAALSGGSREPLSRRWRPGAFALVASDA